MKKVLFCLFFVVCCIHVANAQIWYYDEFRSEEISNDQTPNGGVMVNCALEGNLGKFHGYGDSTVVKKKDASIEASIEYSSEMLGDGDQAITAFYAFCMFRRVNPANSEDLHIKDLFAFYYKTEPDAEWIEYPIDVKMEEVVFPGGWTRSAVVGASLGNVEVTNFKFVLNDKTFEGSGDNWSAYIGKTGVYTGPAIGLDLSKQYSLSTIEDKYWAVDGDDDEGYMVRHATEAVAGSKSAWVFTQHANNLYTIKTGDSSKELAFDMEYAKWNNNLWMGFVMERGGLGAAAPYENHVVKSTYLIGKELDGTYSFRRAQDGRLVGKAENKTEECISVCRPEADYARTVTLTAIGNTTGLNTLTSQVTFATSGQELIITGLEGNNRINIYSIVGVGIVLNDQVNDASASYSLAPGAYVVSVVTESGKINKKVLIK